MKVVIVGGVAGGMSAAARLRRLDERAQIVVLERDGYVSFANCGLPYHLGGEITRRDDLLLHTPETLAQQFAIDVRVRNEVVAIDADARIVTVVDHSAGREYTESYDSLVLSTGASAVVPPLPGIDHPRIRTLRNIPDLDHIEALVDDGARTAVVIGGGYIGLEVTEALRHRGIQVTLVEALDQVMAVLDPEMAQSLHDELVRNGVRLRLSTKARAFVDRDGRVAVDLGDETIVADLAVLAVGVRPESALARSAGLVVAESGAIVVDDQMRTSRPGIFAVGDAVQVTDTVTGLATVVPLAGPANRQGRIAADAIAGRTSRYSSTQGTGIVRVFGLTAAMTGATERTLARAGQPFVKVYLHPNDHAGYFPGASAMHLKVLFDPTDGRLLGAQAVGAAGVDKRIDVLAVALRAGMTIEDLEHLELAYAPPYGSAKDPVNLAGFIGANVRRGDIALWHADQWPDLPADAVLLDVRSAAEHERWAIPGSTLIPLPELRDRLAELPAGAPIYAYCRSGFRSYLAHRILVQAGWPQATTLSGGELTFQAVWPQVAATGIPQPAASLG